MEVTVSGFHGSFYFGTSEYADGKENKSKNEILNSTTTFGGGIYSRTVKVYSFI